MVNYIETNLEDKPIMDIALSAGYDFLVGLNDYSLWMPNEDKQPAFDYYSAAEVTSFSEVPKGMVTAIDLPLERVRKIRFCEIWGKGGG